MKTDRPDLMILDVMMDTTTESFQLALNRRNPHPTSEYQLFSDIPILMLTAIHEKTPICFSLDETYLPVDIFIEKPIDPTDLVSMLPLLVSKSK